MKYVQLVTILFLISRMAAVSMATPKTLFPSENEITSQDNSLHSAMSQFDRILENSTSGDIQSIDSNSEYNQQRIAGLQEQLKLKREYLGTLPELASRQFATMMAQFPDADQARKDKIAHEIQTQFKSIENRTLQEIAELERQLSLSGHRVGEAKMQRQMIEISQSLAEGQKTMGQAGTQPKKEDRPYKDAFEYMQSLSQQRMLSKVQALSVIQVRPLDDEFTPSYLGK